VKLHTGAGVAMLLSANLELLLSITDTSTKVSFGFKPYRTISNKEWKLKNDNNDPWF
jgi:hypothetical protein